MINDGKGNFSVMESLQTGLKVKGQVRDIAALRINGRNCLLFMINNEYPVLYDINAKK